MKTVCIIGAGNIGSRHLQALKNIKTPLSITIVDPSIDSQKIAKERYESFSSLTNSKHGLSFYQDIDKLPQQIDVAIIATNSDVRARVIEILLNHSLVKFMILEKLLFQRKVDYIYIQEMLKNRKCRAFVNCSMRTMPTYYKLKEQIKKAPINYFVTGSRYGLITNAIHYIDHMAFLTGYSEFSVDTSFLDPTLVETKREDFLELNGSLNVHFKDGSFGSFNCFDKGDASIVVEITSPNMRLISKESERKAYISTANKKWQWEEIKTDIPYQSQMTDRIIEDLLSKGTCQLVKFEESAKIHLILLEALQKFLNQHTKKKYTYYPFT